jgi:hypothetical protein
MGSLFLALAAFLAVGVNGLMSGEDLIWAIGKAIGAFFACWIALGVIGNLLNTVLGIQAPQDGKGSVIDDKG